MNVDMVTTYRQYCGIATYSGYLIQAIKQVDPTIDINVLREDVKPTMQPIVNVQTKRMWNRYTKDYDFKIRDTVHIQYEPGLFGYSKPILDSLLATKRRKKKIVITYHMVANEPNVIPFYKAISYIADHTIVHSKDQLEALNRMGVSTERTSIIPHGTYALPSEVNDITVEYPQLKDNQYILMHGFVSADKGYHIVMEAMKRLKDKHPNLYLVVLGSIHPLHPERSQWIVKRYIKKLMGFALKSEIDDRIIFELGFTKEDQLDSWLAQAHLLVYPLSPSGQDVHSSSGNIHRAIGAGVPVIGSDTHRLQDVKESVMMLSELTPIDVASAISYILTNDDVYHEFKEKITTYAQQTSWENVARQHLDVYESLEWHRPIPQFFQEWRHVPA